MHKLFAKQLAKATDASGDVDLNLLGSLVCAAYDETDADRRRTDRSISLMIEELDRFNRDLEEMLVERTNKLKQREAELISQNHRFEAAINHMSQGLCMFDSDKRLVVCNRQYARMYGLSPDQVRPGATLLSILEHRVANGNCPLDADRYIKDRIEEVDQDASYQTTNQLRDGRFVSVLHQPMQSGGWVALHQDVTDQKNAEARIAHMARHDVLTGLPNRVLFQERIAESSRHGPPVLPFALLLIDLDGFKGVNDTLGHAAGDRLLQMVADRLRGCVGDQDTLVRLGGDEFAIIHVSDKPLDTASALAEQIISEIGQPYNIEHTETIVGVSLGISIGPDDGAAPDRLMNQADLSLYCAKREGRGVFRFFDPRMEAHVKNRKALGIDLRRALNTDELSLVYQPLIAVETGRITGFEALARWHHPERGDVSPSEFIPIAEECGLINQIGEWVLVEACREAAVWPDDVNVAINVSPVQFRGGMLMLAVVQALAKSGIRASRLELEITESVLLEDDDVSLDILHQLHNLGVRISLDDFGTGYSSLSYLQRFPFDKIKIDSSFIAHIGRDIDELGIVHAVVSMANRLGVATTAEGVETEEQLAVVRAEGCTEMQGYLLSPPHPAREIANMLRGRNCDPLEVTRNEAQPDGVADLRAS